MNNKHKQGWIFKSKSADTANFTASASTANSNMDL